jgi:predicted secreted protein
MWIVKLGDNTRHSAWRSRMEALIQAEALEDRGYIKPSSDAQTLDEFVEYDETVSCENGHYYV